MKKKIIVAALAALTLSSCSTLYQSASQAEVTSPVAAAALADLDVSSEKISYTLVPTRKVRKGGLQNCINTAIKEALKANGNGDVLIETQQAVVQRAGLFACKIKSVTVTGYPAKYKNFRTADEETVKAALVNGSLKINTIKQKSKTKGSIFSF